MTVFFQNHSFRYAAEQMLSTLFPGETAQYAPDGASAELVLSLSQGITYATATARLRRDGATVRGTARALNPSCSDPLAHDRVLQKILKLAFYRAAVKHLGGEPPWGALTGVRPVKLPTRALLGGASRGEARRQLTEVYRVSAPRADLAMDCAQQSLRVIRELRPGDLSLYVGIPFCPTRCAYCSFVSADVGHSQRLIAPFLSALFLEIEAAGQLIRAHGLTVTSLYLGGGTPTTLSPEQLRALASHLAAHIDLSACAEYTVEAGRPDTITAEKLAVLAACGVTRVSVNPQTMSDDVLAAMGRAHSAQAVEDAFALARAAGTFVINMDLIAGLPRDTPDGFRRSLDAVLALAPENITVHTLALKKGSALLVSGGRDLPDAAAVSAMLQYAAKRLPERGFAPYYLYRQKYMSGSFENIGWCRPGDESRYNICMMEELHSILALGGGGITKLVRPATGQITRIANPKYPKEYIENIHKIIAEKEGLSWRTS